MRRFLFVGEKPSQTAHVNGWRWEDGRLAAKTLFDALQEASIDPTACRFINLFGEHPDDAETVKRAPFSRIQTAYLSGWTIVALGQKVSKRLRIKHLTVTHPAARGAIRRTDVYREHVRNVLVGEAL